MRARLLAELRACDVAADSDVVVMTLVAKLQVWAALTKDERDEMFEIP